MSSAAPRSSPLAARSTTWTAPPPTSTFFPTAG